MTLHLVALDCPSCGSALSGEGLDTIFFCEHCGDAAILGEEGIELVESTALVPAPGRPARTWRPGWMIEADTKISNRVRTGGHPTEGWEGREVFVVPAFEMPLVDLTRVIRAFTDFEGEFREVPREPIHGGTLAVEDAITVIRHVLIGDEVRRSDSLASVAVDIDVVSSRLVALPFEPMPDGLKCSITGVTVRVGD